MSVANIVSVLRHHYGIELALYDRYHKNVINSYIHVVCISFEWAATLLLLHQVNLARTIAFMISACMVPVSTCGVLCSAQFAAMLLIVEHQSATMGLSAWEAVGIAAGVHMSSWGVQVCIGHFLIEGNTPSMTEALSVYGLIFSMLMAWDNSYRKFVSE
jgi:uncharacterized membrane protein YGL010W